MVNDPSGSNWRRWDLHIHTPFSALNHSFPTEFDRYAKGLFEAAVREGIAVVGVTDYFCIEGYKDLKALLADNTRMDQLVDANTKQAVRNMLFLPNIELRTNTIIRRTDGTDSRVNYHIIFSDKLDVNQIEENFLRELKFTAESNPDSMDDRFPLTLANLKLLGKRLKEQHERFRDRDDLEIGMMMATIDHEQVTSVLETKRSIFGSKYLIGIPADEDLSQASWNGQGHLARKIMIQKAHFIFSANPNTHDFGLGRKHRGGAEEFIREFKSLKGCLHGSDAHSIDTLFKPDQNRFMWVKADPTFLGLRMALRAPEERLFIGRIPESVRRLELAKTRYIKSIKFQKQNSMPQGEEWLNTDVRLNPGLVCIIGNKGSGKSAFTDALGLLGNCKTRPFSFLSNERFRNKKTGRAQHIQGTLTWHDGNTSSTLLSDDLHTDEPERVKYLPQNFVEEVCNDFDSSDGKFKEELEKVVFSRIGTADQLRKSSLKELIDYRTQEIQAAIDNERAALGGLSRELVNLEKLMDVEVKSTIEKSILLKKTDIESHERTRPAERTPPSVDPATQAVTQEAANRLKVLQENLVKIEDDIRAADEVIKEQGLRVVQAKKLEEKMRNLETEVARHQLGINQDASALGLDAKLLVKFSIDLTPVRAIHAEAEKKKVDAQDKLDAELPNGLKATKFQYESQAKEARELLDAPNREYQEFLEESRLWKARLDQLQGSQSDPDSLLGLEKKLSDLATVPERISKTKKSLFDVAKRIHALHLEEMKVYSELYSSVQEIIDQNSFARDELKMEFRVELEQRGFSAEFFNFINQGRAGSFYKIDAAQGLLASLMETIDWSNWAGVNEFLLAIDDHLHFDRRNGGTTKVSPFSQLLQGKELNHLYEWLFGMSYLKPQYVLRSNGKNLEQLSPGERGIMLLVFYLFVDNSDVPVIIDQPEANLDNDTIARKVVRCIKDARSRRQVIVVTHNPNLAVVCDADQVIHASLDHAAGHKIRYISGGIENAEINTFTINVLEGGRAPFDIRDDVYQIGGNSA